MAGDTDGTRQPAPQAAAVLDACVLVPLTLRGLLLHSAEQEMFRPVWSEPILNETRGVLLGKNMISERQWTGLDGALRRAFPHACVHTREVRHLEPAMRNDPKDRHVVAAAVAARAPVIVTNNLRDFQPTDLDRVGVRAVHPDAFLVGLLNRAPGQMRDALTGHVNAMRMDSRWSEAQVLGQLKGLGRARAIAPRFAARAERVFGIRAVPPPARDVPRLDLSRTTHRASPPSRGLSGRTPARGRTVI